MGNERAETAAKLYDLYHRSKNRDDFTAAAVNGLIVGYRGEAELAWECIDRVYDQNQWVNL